MSGAREHPRLAVAVQVRVELPGGGMLEGLTQNLSCAGFQMRGDQVAAAALFPGGLQPTPRDRREALAVLSAESADSEARPMSVNVRCTAVFARRVAESQFQMGFQFQDMSPDVLAWVEARIATGLRHARRPQTGG
jgi:hypothetical protein